MIEDDDISAKRDRSPPFPYLGLAGSIELTKKLYQVAKGAEVRLAQIAPHWNTTPTSGALARYAGALQGYGLIESSGTGESRKIKITDVGRRLLEDTRPGVGEELRATAALRPKLFEELYRIWGKSRPADDIARSALQFDHDFTPVAAKRFLGVFDEALSYLPSEVSAPSVEPVPTAQERPEKSSVAVGDLDGRPEVVEPTAPSSGVRRDVFALDEGEATITLPRILSRASFEDLEAWLELIRRKAERSVRD